MSYRERSAWIALATYLIVFGGYFLTLWQSWDESYARGLTIGLTVGAVIMLIIIAVSLETISAIWSPREANAAADERETLIDLRAERWASYTLAVGVVCLIGALLMDWNAILVANLLQASLVTSAVVKAIAQIVQFRRGA